MLLGARHAISFVAVPFAFVFVAIENLLTFFSTLKYLSLLAALDDSLSFPTIAVDHGSFLIAGRALARVTESWAVV